MRRCAGTSLGLRCSRVVVLRRHDPLERQALTGEIDASVAPATNTATAMGGNVSKNTKPRIITSAIVPSTRITRR